MSSGVARKAVIADRDGGRRSWGERPVAPVRLQLCPICRPLRLRSIVDSIVGYEMVTAAGKVVRVDGARDPELFWGMRGNGASFGIVTEFVVREELVDGH